MGLRNQPQGLVRVARGPHLAGLRALAMPGGPELITGAWPTVVSGVGGLEYGLTPAGRSWTLTQDIFEFSNIPWQAGSFSFLFVLVKKNVIDTVASFGGAGAGRGWRFGSSGSGPANARMTFGNVADYELGSGFFDVNGGVTIGLLSVENGKAKLYKNVGGVGQLFSTTNVGTHQAPTRPLTVGGYFSTTYAEHSSSDISLISLWGRGTPEASAISLVSNPWILFEDSGEEEDYRTASTGNDATASPSGVTAVASIGSVIAAGGAKATPVGVSATGAIGIATASAGTSGDAAPSGVSAVATVGTVTAAAGARVAPDGVTATAQVGQAVATAGGNGMALPAGIGAAASVGAPTASGGAACTPAGVSAAASVGAVIASPSPWIDVSKISSARIVVFEGSGSRVAPFESSGSRVTPFDGSGSRVTPFEGSGTRTVRYE